ncbi:hypothetical protein ACFLTS_05400 [Chloroflexota bacterium]
MASLGMEGPYNMDIATIEAHIAQMSPGNYALGRENEKGQFLIGCVGRSDSDIGTGLKLWVGRTDRPLFKFSYAISAEAAFEKECDNYHDFKRSTKEAHPNRPVGTNFRCAHCDIFD